ncbi:Ig-like repeat domain protein 3 [Vibrio astriarenae]|nr:Ig-like repeat domain protein 3 [Vibrio sp. C7]
MTWLSQESGTATVSPGGLLSGVEVGNTTVTAIKESLTSNIVNINISAAVITAIQITPAIVGVVKGQNQQVIATATYSDGTLSDISNSVTWTSVETSTATVTPVGSLSGIEVGSTTVTATRDGIISDIMNVTVCSNVSGACIDTFDIGNGTLLTNSPSVAYLDIIGGGATNGFYTEDGNFGPSGDFYFFIWSNANALCDIYNAQNLEGRNNWSLTTQNDLVGLYNSFGNMFTLRNWPTVRSYWSATISINFYYGARLRDGVTGLYDPTYPAYASCISKH